MPATVQRARIEAQLGIISLWRGRPRESVDWFTRAIADGESVDATKALAHAFAGLDLAYHDLGDPARAVHSARALELYEELGDLVSQGGVLNNLGTIAYFGGRWDEALELYGQARAAWEQAGDTRSVSMASFNIGEILSAQGRLDEAEPLLREAERASRAAGGTTDIAESIIETALLEARRGNIARALERLEDARRLLERDRRSGCDAARRRTHRRGARTGGRARPRRRAGGEDAGARAARTRGGERPLRPVLNRVLGQAHLLAGRVERAREALERAIAEAIASSTATRRRSPSQRSAGSTASRARRPSAGMPCSRSSASSRCLPASSPRRGEASARPPSYRMRLSRRPSAWGRSRACRRS